MKKLLTLRLEENDKRALALASDLSEMPVSRMIVPFIEDGTKVSLGSVLLFHIDRKKTFDRRLLEEFLNMITEPGRTGRPMMPVRTPEYVKRKSPAIVWDFFDLFSQTNALSRLNNAFDEVELTMNTSYVTPEFLNTFCHGLGSDYLAAGADLERLDFQLSSRLFFESMLSEFFRYNARGTSDKLTSEFYSHREFMNDISSEMEKRYAEITSKKKFKAIEVESGSSRRGRPSRKTRRSRSRKVIAKEIGRQ